MADGSAVGADTARLVDLVAATPISAAWSWRWFLPLELVHPMGWAFGSGVPWPDEVKWWDATAVAALAYPVKPGPRYTTLGFVQDLGIPLVLPDNLRPGEDLESLLVRLATVDPKVLVGAQRELFYRVPNSLLVRLVLLSLIITAAEVAREAAAAVDPMLEPPYVADTIASTIASWTGQFAPSQVGGSAASRLYQAARDGALGLAGMDPDEIERSLGATLDAASHRIDPWVTGLAWRRLRALPSPHFELGAYGWVDAPAAIGSRRRLPGGVPARPVRGPGPRRGDPARPGRVRCRARALGHGP